MFISVYHLVLTDHNLTQQITEYPSNCPPIDAVEYDGYIYIYVKNIPPQAKELLSAAETNRYPEADPCQRHSISCGISNEYLNFMEKLFPIHKKWKKARGMINKEDGVIKQTSANVLHHSFWMNCKLKSTIHLKFQGI